MDEAFDLLNSRGKFGKGLAAPISPANYRAVVAKGDELCAYFSGLTTTDGTLISRSRRSEHDSFLSRH